MRRPGIFTIICVIVVIGVAAVDVQNEFDKRVNFRSVDARIDAVKEQCYLEKPDGLRKTWTSDLMPCERATYLTREHPKWRDYEIKHKIEVRFAYASPVDGVMRTSRVELSAYPDGRPLQAGDVFPVQASRTVETLTRANDWLDRQLGRDAPRRGST